MQKNAIQKLVCVTVKISQLERTVNDAFLVTMETQPEEKPTTVKNAPAFSVVNVSR